MKGFILIVIISSLCYVTPQDYPKFRLRNALTVSLYEIRILPNISDDSFYGEANIYLELQHNIPYIALNIKDITIQDLVLDNRKEETDFKINDKYEILIINYKYESHIDPGEHMLHIKYKGTIRSDSIGLFKGVIESGEKKFLSLATMFSAPYARMVFPCLDEPAYKSTFSIRLVKPDNTFTALSNMAEKNSLEVKESIAVDFQTTPSISPYLVCFVLTQYNYRSTEYFSIDGRRVPLRFFMLDEYLDQAPFLLEVARQALQFFENYTNMTYPVSKLDFIEIPNFIYEGMENIGLVILTHNSASFNTSSHISKVVHQRNAAQLVVHEISHMWFGDIVTPMWYNDLWLAEGFAQLMEIKGLQNQYPTWQLEDVDDVLRHDSLFYADNAPIVNFPQNNEQVEEQFGDITYVKGSAILRMLEMIMGPKKFQIGIKKFLKDFYMESVTTGAFINVMESITPTINLRGFLETWLYQDKFPLLIVMRKKSTNSFILRQKSFISRSSTSSIFGRKWTIPVTFSSSCNKNSSLNWLDKDADILRIPSCGEKWIKFNHKSIGFYRVLYAEEQYEQLLQNFDELDQVDQANLILETFHLFREMLIPCDKTLQFIGKLRGRKGLLPSLASFKVIHVLMIIYSNNQSVQLKLRKYFIETFEELYKRLTWVVDKKDDPVVRLLRSELIKNLCYFDIRYEKCIQDGEDAKKKIGEIHHDLLHIWKKIIHMKGRFTATDKMYAKNSTKNSDENDSDTPLFLEKCMTWIKLNL